MGTRWRLWWVVLAGVCAVGVRPGLPADLRPRIVVTTDLGADPDDEQSMVRFLVCSNEFDVEGLVVSTSCWKRSQVDTVLLDRIIVAYEKVYPNLCVHAAGYPAPQRLRSVAVLGQRGYGMTDVGDGRDSPGSDLIIAAADREDPRPLWVACWGGTNTVAQAVWKIRRNRSEAELSEFLSRLRVFDILGQDDCGAWLTKTFPELFYIRARKVYGWAPPDEWIDTHVQSHGPLGSVYPDRKWATEGDTASFLHIYPNGLHDPERVDQGGWGGRFSVEPVAGLRGMSKVKEISNESRYDPYFMLTDTAEDDAIRRWQPAIDNDFQARMDWTVTPDYARANHHPVAVVNGDGSRAVLTIQAAPGQAVTLDAGDSSDPDGDALAYRWFWFREPSSYRAAVQITGASTAQASVQVPDDAAGKSLHIVLEVRDEGTPCLYAYRRIVVEVR